VEINQIYKELGPIEMYRTALSKSYVNSSSFSLEPQKTEEQYTMLGKQAAEIAHEIKNPLTTIKGFLQLIQPYLKDINKEEYATIAIDEIKRVDDILSSFLNAAKPMEEVNRVLNINEIVHHSAKLFESESIIKNIHLTTSLSNKNPHIIFNENKLKQVLINLIKNAFEAIEETQNGSGFIEVITEVAGINAQIHVIDSGCGMTNKIINQLFTPFFTTKDAGTGIGLSVCKQIIESYGGNISIASTKGTGTKITIALPITSL
jgi:signal transduction histidine kinase